MNSTINYTSYEILHFHTIYITIQIKSTLDIFKIPCIPIEVSTIMSK